VKLPLTGMGDMLFLLVPDEEWEPLKASWLDALVSHVEAEAVRHALNGYSVPLVRALGISPVGALHKIPHAYFLCREVACPSRDQRCNPLSKKCPLCYSLAGPFEGQTLLIANRVVEKWREGGYVIIWTGE